MKRRNASAESARQLRIKKMLHFRFAADVCEHLLLQIAIGVCLAFVLTQMFRPRPETTEYSIVTNTGPANCSGFNSWTITGVRK